MQFTEYQKTAEDDQRRSDKLTAMCSRISFWRGISFATAVLLLAIGYSQQNTIYGFAASAALLAFLLLVHHHSKIEAKQRFLADRLAVVWDHLARFCDDWKQFPVNGARYLNDDLTEARDLDIFGQDSLYQYICTASTIFGQDQLADWLSHPSKSADCIKSRQQAVAELTQKPAFTMEFETAARSLRNEPYEHAQAAMNDFFASLEPAAPTDHFDKSFHHKAAASAAILYRAMIWIFPAVTLLFLLLAVLGYRQPFSVSCFLCLAFLQLMASFITFHRTDRLLAPVYRLNRTITPYRKLLELIESESFDSTLMRTLQQNLVQKTSASAALKELGAIADAVMLRHNLLALVLCNCLFLHDLHCIDRYIRWKDNYRDLCRTWLETAGQVESLISLGVIFHTKETATLPQIEPETAAPNEMRPVLSAAGISHPLLKESAAVGNDITFRHNTCIITGSNMSGKTTFMRSIGVNLILAYAGGYCTARSLHVSLMELCTSMRTQDNVNEGISTFYAELLRIKKMIETSKKRLPMIALIDEIYKGTNTKDRIYAARETVKRLSQPYALTVLTTHDLELCDLENDSCIDAENYYFTEHYEQNKILFDYKIRKGRCTTTNARYLLRIAGIL